MLFIVVVMVVIVVVIVIVDLYQIGFDVLVVLWQVGWIGGDQWFGEVDVVQVVFVGCGMVVGKDIGQYQ